MSENIKSISSVIKFNNILQETAPESVALRLTHNTRFLPAFINETTGKVYIMDSGFHNNEELKEKITKDGDGVLYDDEELYVVVGNGRNDAQNILDGFWDTQTETFLDRDEVSALVKDQPNPNEEELNNAKNALSQKYALSDIEFNEKRKRDIEEFRKRKKLSLVEVLEEADAKQSPYFLAAVDFTISDWNEKRVERTIRDFPSMILRGVEGISGSKFLVAKWYSLRNALLVMRRDKVLELNDIVEVNYSNPEQLLANNMDILKRLFN